MFFRFSFVFACIFAPLLGAGALVDQPSADWQAIGMNFSDGSGPPAGPAIVGTVSDPGFFTTFARNGLVSNTDGTLGFRIRLDASSGSPVNPSFNQVLQVGLDANLDGQFDAVLGLNFQGNNSEIFINDALGLNSSPQSPAGGYSYAANALNYSYRPVDYLFDGGTTNDVSLSTSGDPDYYVSFAMPFADIVSVLSTQGILITDATEVRYGLAVSNQANSTIQGAGGGAGGGADITTLNAQNTLSPLVSFAPVPEPNVALYAGVASILLLVRRRSHASSVSKS